MNLIKKEEENLEEITSAPQANQREIRKREGRERKFERKRSFACFVPRRNEYSNNPNYLAIFVKNPTESIPGIGGSLKMGKVTNLKIRQAIQINLSGIPA